MLAAVGGALYDVYDTTEQRWADEQIRASQTRAWAIAEMDYLRLVAALARSEADDGTHPEDVIQRSSAFFLSIDAAEQTLRRRGAAVPAATEELLPALQALQAASASSYQGPVGVLGAKEFERRVIPLGPLLHDMVQASRPSLATSPLWLGLASRQVVLIAIGIAGGILLLLLLVRQVRHGAAQQATAERERATAAAGRARFEDAIESLSEGFAIYDADDRLVLCNDRQRAAHPHVPEAFRPGRRYDDIMRDILMTGVAESDVAAAEATLAQLTNLHRAKDGFFERRTADGGWIRLSKRHTREGGVVTLRADISELKAQQQELAEKTALLQTILDNIGSGIAAYDQNFRLIAWNEHYLRINDVPAGFLQVGMAMEEVARRNFHAGVFGAHDVEVRLAQRIEMLRRGEARHELQERRNGRIVDVVVQPLPTGGSLTLLTDITEQRRAEEEHRQLEAHLQHTQRVEALGTLAGGIAHDLNNSLVPVLGLTDLLLRKVKDEAERRKLALVRQGASRARDLVKQILAFSRKDASKREGFDLAEVVQEALDMLRATIPTTIRLEPEIAAVPPLRGDSGQLYQVIVNLMTNAAQAIGERAGTIYISLAEDYGDQLPDARFVCLSVRDTGCGIGESVLPRIFEPFFTTKDVGKGTGLGLSVVHGIIIDHGGKIVVASRPGEGTTFDVYLPIGDAATPAATAEMARQPIRAAQQST
jgi:signal transduction histidine kinase